VGAYQVTGWWKHIKTQAGGSISRHRLVETYQVTGWWKHIKTQAGGNISSHRLVEAYQDTGWWEHIKSQAGGNISSHRLVEAYQVTGWWKSCISYQQWTVVWGGGGITRWLMAAEPAIQVDPLLRFACVCVLDHLPVCVWQILTNDDVLFWAVVCSVIERCHLQELDTCGREYASSMDAMQLCLDDIRRQCQDKDTRIEQLQEQYDKLEVTDCIAYVCSADFFVATSEMWCWCHWSQG